MRIFYLVIQFGFEWVYTITSFVTHEKTYVSNGLNEFAWSQVLSHTYDFKNVSARKKIMKSDPKIT